MRKITSDYIFDGFKLHQNMIIEVDQNGQLISLENGEITSDVEHFKGLIMPGFINAHCHLELSHLQNKVATGTGLLPFLSNVVQFREVEQDIVDQAIEKHDQYMWDHGIQAVGDISNKLDTAKVKAKSPIQYYSFVEMFDLLQDSFTENSYNQYAEVFDGFDTNNQNQYSAVPHAPYTVTKGLFERINKLNSNKRTVSIHNQETPHENQYFQDKSGGFSSFYSGLGIDDSGFQSIGKDSIYYAMENMDSNHRTLFVHNTLSTEKNIADAKHWSKDVFWATCPNANLYIENSLPNYQAFIDQDATVCIGTDSLTSNWQLCILEEIKTIQKFNSYIEPETLLKWSTINGAMALGFEEKLGSFEVGKTPGIIQLKEFQGNSFQDCSVQRIL